MSHALQLLAEWYPQEAIVLAWPDEKTDWAPWLPQVHNTYLSLIDAITSKQCGVILLVRAERIDEVQRRLKDQKNIMLVSANYNDTWCRDYAFLTCRDEQKMVPVEFTFNGWGNKFNASLDNQINQKVLAPLCQQPLVTYPLVCEGGALEIDQEGHLLSTALCLSNPERNGNKSLSSYQQDFAQMLGASQTTIFSDGHLEGDDTDGHIDTLVRFTPHNGLVVQSAFNRPDDGHFEGLAALVQACQSAFPQHKVFELPLPHIVNAEGERLPASYANYLINNQQILCPTYQQPEDSAALAILAQAYPDFQIVAIDSLPLVQQFGSIHCISMQVPKGTLKAQVVEQLQRGVSIYEH